MNIVTNDIHDLFVKITVDDMQQVFGFTPRPFQQEVIPHLIKMKNNNNFPTLLVHGTVGAKSSMRQTVKITKGGVILITQTTLSLSPDQMSKMQLTSSKCEGVHSIQLDSIKVESHK